MKEQKAASYKFRLTQALGILGVTFLLVFIAPIPDLSVITQIEPLFSSHKVNAVVVVGNSVVGHVSPCDQDMRTISQLLADDSSRQVVDLGAAGQSLDMSINLAAIALSRANVSQVVVYVSSVSLTEVSYPDLQTQFFFREAASSDYFSNSLNPRLRTLTLFGPIDRPMSGFSYKGVNYPDYEGIKNTYFSYEKEHMGCPETAGHYLNFIEAYYWHAYLSQPFEEGYIRDLASLQKRGDSVRKKVEIVLLPIDYGDVGDLNPQLAQQIMHRRDEILRSFEKFGLRATDLSSVLFKEAFADRWCACGHLNQTGRAAVAARTLPL